jgi:hypothetical protein
MSVITISRGSYSGGKMLAERVAHKLNYRCIDRDVLTQRTSIRSVSPNELFAALETPPANLWHSLNHRKYLYLTLVQAALLEEVSNDNVVYHGLAGQLLLQGGLAILRIRVVAPLEFRIQMAQERMNLSRAEAITHIRKVDEHRDKWVQYLYGVDWQDPSLYDLVINLQNMNIDQACRLICGMIKEGGFEFSSKHQSALRDLVLASRVRAALAKDALTSNVKVEVNACNGHVTIRGELCDDSEEVQRVASAVPGVLQLTLQELTLQETAFAGGV